MDNASLREAMRRRAQERAQRPALDVVRSLLSTHFGDAEGEEEVERHLRSQAEYTTAGLRQELVALEDVLGQPQEAGVLADIVAWDANWVLDDPSDEGARVFLREFADLVRRVIEEAEGPES